LNKNDDHKNTKKKDFTGDFLSLFELISYIYYLFSLKHITEKS